MLHAKLCSCPHRHHPHPHRLSPIPKPAWPQGNTTSEPIQENESGPTFTVTVTAHGHHSNTLYTVTTSIFSPAFLSMSTIS